MLEEAISILLAADSSVKVYLYGSSACFLPLEKRVVRQPDAQLGYLWGGWLTMGQVLSVPALAIGEATELLYVF